MATTRTQLSPAFKKRAEIRDLQSKLDKAKIDLADAAARKKDIQNKIKVLRLNA